MFQYLLLAGYCYTLHLTRTIYQYLLLAVYCYTVTSGRNNLPIFTVGCLLLHRYIWPEQCPNIYCWLSTVTPLHMAGTMSQYLLLAVYCYTVTYGRNNVPIFTVGCLLLHRYIWPEQCPNIYCWLSTVTPLHMAGTMSQYLLLVVYCYTVTSGLNNVPIFTVGWLLLHVTSDQNNLPIFTVGCLLLHRYIWPEQCPNIYCWLSTVTPLHMAGTMSQYLLLAVYCYTVTSGRNNIYCWLATVTPLHLAGTMSQYLLLAGYCYTVTSGRNNVPIFTVGCLLLHRYIWLKDCPSIYCWLSTVTPLHLAGTTASVTPGATNDSVFTASHCLY